MTILTRPTVRRWLYGIATAALVLLGTYGLLDGQQIAAWTGLAAAITGLAWANTPTPTTARHAADD